MLLAPEKTNPATLGDLIGRPKLEIPPPYSITNMKRLLDEQPEVFKAYAIRDAEIAVRYALYVLEIFKSSGSLGGSRPSRPRARRCSESSSYPNKIGSCFSARIGLQEARSARVTDPPASSAR
jgi:hypothetical protein